MQEALDRVGISLNKNTLPKDPASPFYPSGIRMGTPSMTMRGMKEDDMKEVARFIASVADIIAGFSFSDEDKKEILSSFRLFIRENAELDIISESVKTLARKFPIYS